MSVITAPTIRTDPHIEAFCRGTGAEVFNAVVRPNQIWSADPFDVLAIHREAREVFGRLVNRAITRDQLTHGKTLLLLGEAGSGKTHLMRAFRTLIHREQSGYCGYLQMTTRVDNYARYILSNLIDSLDWPYFGTSSGSGLSRLASGLLDSLDTISPTDKQTLREEALEPDQLARLVFRLADVVVADPQYASTDLNLIRAILYLLSPDNRIRSRALNWLRCEEMPRVDREMIGELPQRSQPEMPRRTIALLGQLMAAVHSSALVLCVDQLEHMLDQSMPEEERNLLFRRAIDTLVSVGEDVPTSIVVVACLEDYYTAAKSILVQSCRDRLERDPEPLRLNSKRTLEEIEAILVPRLAALYDEVQLPRPIYPFTSEQLTPLVGLRSRDILDECRCHQERCAKAGQWLKPEWKGDSGAEKPLPVDLQREWSDFRTSFQTPTLDDEADAAQLLGWAIERMSDEMSDGVHFGCQPDDRFLPVELHSDTNQVEKRLVAICDRGTQRRALLTQLEAVEKRGGEIPAVIVRSLAFPTGKKADVNLYLGKRLAPNGNWRKVVVENAEWRAMAAFRQFWTQHHNRPGFAEWQRTERPLSALPSLPIILKRETLLPAPPATQPVIELPPLAPSQLSLPPVEPQPVPTAPLLLGMKQGTNPGPVTIPVKELTRHAAFLGSPGSGKTTAALRLIEQLLRQGIPAILIDRKGDLARYADPSVWDETDERSTERRELRTCVEVALYTPGSPAGRALLLPLVPDGFARLNATERQAVAQDVASALCSMMGYRTRAEEAREVILTRAIEILASSPDRKLSVQALKDLIHDQDEELVAALDGYANRHYKTLAENLLTLHSRHRRLFEGEGEPLDFDRLFGKRAYAQPGKARLTIINTQFLGGSGPLDFWMAQFLISLFRWGTQHPSPDGALQAVCLFDEADQYLPAQGVTPATKKPMENLLRRIRAAGIGIFLATQNPGDFDYRCRDQINLWLLGRIRSDRALEKVKPMLEAAKTNVEDKLPNLKTGEFYSVQENGITSVMVTPSLVKTQQVPEAKIGDLARGTR